MQKKSKKNIRIFLGLIEIAGYYTNLKQGMDALGIKSTFVNLKEHPFKYKDQKDIILIKLYRYVRRIRAAAPHTKHLKQISLKFLQKFLLVIIFIWAVSKHDVFIFGFGTSFFHYHDLPILKALGKKIIFVFFGDDIRPAFMGGMKRRISSHELISFIKRKKNELSKIECFADIIVSYPLFSHFLKKPFINCLYIGIPSVSNIKESQMGSNTIGECIRILHSPSNPEMKGTFKIRASIENLKSKGYAIDYREITGKPNAVVLSEIDKSDFIVDQIYSDTPMAGFATEAAFAGKPAIVGGYGWKEIENIYAPDRIPPSYRCHPDDLESTIEKLIIDKSLRFSLGMEAKNFIDKHWSAKEVAKRFLTLIEGNIPSDWIYEPKNIRYLHGAGLSEDETKRTLRSIITTGGTEAFQLDDKPELEKIFVEFANS